MTPERRCALYLRVSLDATGEMLAVSRQREACRRIAADRGWKIVGEYVDNSISASDARKVRPGYDALLKAYDAGEFTALVCWDLDRLTRQPRQLEDWIDRAVEGSCVIVTANGEADLSTDGGRTFARIKLAVARGEVERKSARQIAASRQRADLGRPPKGVRLTGYLPDGTIVPDEAAVVRSIFDKFAAGDTLRGIAADLTERGVPSRNGARWHSSTIRTMLLNPRYAGRAVYQGAETGKAGEWEPIVSEDVFAVVQGRLSDPRRATNRLGTDRKHLGSSLYRCGVCGGRVRANSGRYWCPEGGHVTRTMTGIDELVREVLRRRLAMPDMLAGLRRHDDGGEGAALNTRAAEVRARVQRFESDYDAGVIDGKRYATAIAKARAELEQIDRARAAVLGNTALSAVAGKPDPGAAWDAAALGVQRAILDALVTVTLLKHPQGRKGFDPDTVRIEWNQ